MELRAAKASADRALQAEQQHAVTLHQQMDVASQEHAIFLRLLCDALSESEAESVTALTHSEETLELQEQIYQWQLHAAEEHVREGSEGWARRRDESLAVETELRKEVTRLGPSSRTTGT